MAVEFRLPVLGENIDSADIIKVLVSKGDKIKADQVLLEIETDKATVEVPSESSGVIKDIMVKEGDKAKVGQVLLTIESNGEVSSDDKRVKSEKGEVGGEKGKVRSETESTDKKMSEKASKSEGGESQKKSSKQASSEVKTLIEIKIPALGENVEEADIIKVLISPGDKIKKDQALVEIETDKASAEIPSEYSGIIKEVKVKEGDKAKVGHIIAIVETRDGSLQIEPENEPTSQAEEVKTGESKEIKKEVEAEPVYHSKQVELPDIIVPAAPSVRRFAREIGIDIHIVKGSGPGGRISIDDVKSFSKSLNEKISKAGSVLASFGLGAERLPDFSKWGMIEKTSMSNVRRKTAEHLSYAWATIPHVTQFDKADITDLEKLRKQFAKMAEEAGGKLTITSILLKVVASALKLFPQFNSSIDMEKKEIIYKKYYHIGVAVDTEKGLLVPVIKDVDKKNIIDLSVELNEISQKARDKKISLEEMQGGTFSISNLGGIGGTNFTPVVNSPEVAILGVSRGNYEPVYKDGEFIPRLMLPLSLSYDHRIIDGADGIRFLRWIVEALEQPFLLSIEG